MKMFFAGLEGVWILGSQNVMGLGYGVTLVITSVSKVLFMNFELATTFSHLSFFFFFLHKISPMYGMYQYQICSSSSERQNSENPLANG